ncbi:FMC1 protein family [Colletotrichum orchidophilum]|uniref:FMC1 protein family n=1 Tax=Colletotrichum orchidophilum TaxID=1209926 RepID=A0A1G4BFZ6_9PEZI|nr:FMC1 protein family [Colletotrichum orchidophilum]OHF00285.1 FMC1 protein family [Colletotrichum orchidophilum]
MTTVPRLRSLYRSLLRELPPRPVLARERSAIHNRLRASFAAHGNVAAVADATAKPRAEADAAEAEQFAVYLRAQRTYVTLLERYNPGMNMDEEERVRLTARRVGMDLPKEFNDRLKN